MTFSPDERQRFIEFRLTWEGTINRRDLSETFGVSVPQASNDLRRFLMDYPGVLEYDARKKTYRATSGFQPRLAAPDPEAYFLHLRRLGAAGAPSWLNHGVPFAETPFLGREVVASHLTTVVAAIRDRTALRVIYQTMKSEETKQLVIEPHALGSDGFRWHARAFVPAHARFRDFVLSRLADARIAGASTSTPEQDLLWRREIEVGLRANRNLGRGPRRAVEAEYRMRNGRLAVRVRVALLPYFLTEHRLDFDPDEKAPKAVHRLEVENVEEVEAALLETDFLTERAGRGLRVQTRF